MKSHTPERSCIYATLFDGIDFMDIAFKSINESLYVTRTLQLKKNITFKRVRFFLIARSIYMLYLSRNYRLSGKASISRST